MTYLKGFVLALVLGNVVYFLWARDLASTEPAAVSAPAASNIRLASEAPELAHSSSAEVMHEDSAEGVTVNGVPANTGGSGSDVQSDDMSAALLSNVKRCVSVGPFRDVAEASHAAATLRSTGYGPRQRVAEGEVWAGVWVYLPRPDARDAAELMLATLKKAGIDDALEMPGPNDSPVVSLGLFSEPKRAQARVAQAQAVGLKPAVADRKRNGNVYWIDVDLKSTEGLLNPSDLRGEAGRIIRLEVKACPAPSPP